MVAACPTTLIGLRDRELLAFSFAGAFRRSELLALEVSDLTEVPDGLRVLNPAKQTRLERGRSGPARELARLESTGPLFGYGMEVDR